MGVEDGLYVEHILTRAHERVGYEVHPEVDGVVDILAVALGERRQLYGYAGYVDTLARAELAPVLCRGVDGVPVDGLHEEVYLSVVDEQVGADVDVAGYVGVGEAYLLVGGHSVGSAVESHLVTLGKRDVRVALVGRGAYLGTLGVHEDADGGGDGAHVVDNAAEALKLQVG